MDLPPNNPIEDMSGWQTRLGLVWTSLCHGSGTTRLNPETVPSHRVSEDPREIQQRSRGENLWLRDRYTGPPQRFHQGTGLPWPERHVVCVISSHHRWFIFFFWQNKQVGTLKKKEVGTQTCFDKKGLHSRPYRLYFPRGVFVLFSTRETQCGPFF